MGRGEFDFRWIRKASIGVMFPFVVLVFMFLVAGAWGALALSLLLLPLLVLVYVYLTYFCERYVLWAVINYTLCILGFLFMACASVFLAATNFSFEAGWVTKFSIAIPILASGVVLYFVLKGERKGCAFPCNGDRVGRLPGSDRAPNYNFGLIGGLSGVVVWLMRQYFDKAALEVFMAILTVGTLMALMWVPRDGLRGMRFLFAQEQDTGVRYTFMLIEEIREARKQTYLVRSLLWLRSRRISWVGTLVACIRRLSR